MAKTITLPERQDADGPWHQVIRDVCYGCGCRYLIAEDDHDLVWEPGAGARAALHRRGVRLPPHAGDRRTPLVTPARRANSCTTAA